MLFYGLWFRLLAGSLVLFGQGAFLCIGNRFLAQISSRFVRLRIRFPAVEVDIDDQGVRSIIGNLRLQSGGLAALVLEQNTDSLNRDQGDRKSVV